MCTWTSVHNGGNATSADLQALAEQVNGVQLDGIFDAWVYGTGMPTVTS